MTFYRDLFRSAGSLLSVGSGSRGLERDLLAACGLQQRKSTVSAAPLEGDTLTATPQWVQRAPAVPRRRVVLGRAVFESDVISMNGLDDRLSTLGVIEHAQELVADAVDAEHAVFSTCGSSLSIKSAMLSVAGPHEKLLVARQPHKSVVSGLSLSGVAPVWVRPLWDADLHLSHPPGAEDVRKAFEAEPDAKGMLLVTPTDYGTWGDIAAVAEVCHEFGKPLIVGEAWGAHLPVPPGPAAMGDGRQRRPVRDQAQDTRWLWRLSTTWLAPADC